MKRILEKERIEILQILSHLTSNRYLFHDSLTVNSNFLERNQSRLWKSRCYVKQGKRRRGREKNPGKFGKLANLGRKRLARTREDESRPESDPFPLDNSRKKNSRFLLLEFIVVRGYIYVGQRRNVECRRLAISRSR